MTTLFSPVGTADPFTQLGDGPMLHIVRHYAPERVVLFLSPEMQEYRQADMQHAFAHDAREYGRYEASIRRLCAAEGRPLPSIEYVYSPYNDVFRFDHYIDEFEGVLERLCAESQGEPVLVNATSGTPAFQQSLVALGSFGRLPLKVLQVVTPKKRSNSQNDREKASTFDLDTLWEWNESLRGSDPEARKSRVIEVKTPNFAERLLRENVITLLHAYDYEAAHKLASEMHTIDTKALSMIEAARDRLNLDDSGVLKEQDFGRSDLAYRDYDRVGEYLSVMEVRLKQGHWAEFVRLLTPVLTQMSKSILRKNELPESSYLIIRNGKPSDVLNWKRIENSERLRRILGTPSKNDRPTYVTGYMLSNLVAEYCQDKVAKEKLRKLRQVESGCRNVVAHQMVPSNKEELEKLGGMSLEDVLQYLFDLRGNVRHDLYSLINDTIIGYM